MTDSDLSRADAIEELERRSPCDVVTARKAQSIADPFDVELNEIDMEMLSDAAPEFFGEDQRGVSVSELVVMIARGTGAEVESPRVTGMTDYGFLARAKYEHNLPKLYEDSPDGE